jgi:hypothetical protein
MLDIEKMINIKTGNTLEFVEPNIYVELDKDGDVVDSYTDCENDNSDIITVKSSDGNFRKVAIPKKISTITGIYKPWKNEEWGNSMPDHW